MNADKAHVARAAFRDCGRRPHRAALNPGDRFAHALAKAFDEPARPKGTSFFLTAVAMYSDG